MDKYGEKDDDYMSHELMTDRDYRQTDCKSINDVMYYI